MTQSPSRTAPRVDVPAGRASPWGWLWAVVVGALIIAAPLWLWNDPLDGYSPRSEGMTGLLARMAPLANPFGRARLALDDYDYIAESRTTSDLSKYIWIPHNTHFVPLFRIWSYLWLRVAGTLGRAPEILGLAAYISYAMAILLIGHIVSWETGRVEWGLGAMACFGISALLAQTVSWFAASQAVLAGVAVLAMLAALQFWRIWGGWWWIALALLSALAAPLLWSVGYVAGPAGCAYLWSAGEPRSRRLAALPMIASVIVAASAIAVAGGRITAPENFHDRSIRGAVDPMQGLASTMQGVIEILVLRNLGLDAPTTPTQALVLVVAVAAIWAWTRGGAFRPNPLEAAGAVMVFLGFGLVYTARGYFTFDNLRDLSWYQAIPQMGAVLFASGWWAGSSAIGSARSPAAPRPAVLAAILGFVMLLFMLQTPRVRTQLVAGAPPLAASERSRFPVPSLQRLRARFLQNERAAWQRRFLARLDRAEATARRHSWSREAVRKGVGRLGPMALGDMPHIDAVNLLALPETGGASEPGRVAAALRPILIQEPEPRPTWLEPGDLWPPRAP